MQREAGVKDFERKYKNNPSQKVKGLGFGPSSGRGKSWACFSLILRHFTDRFILFMIIFHSCTLLCPPPTGPVPDAIKRSAKSGGPVSILCHKQITTVYLLSCRSGLQPRAKILPLLFHPVIFLSRIVICGFIIVVVMWHALAQRHHLLAFHSTKRLLPLLVNLQIS